MKPKMIIVSELRQNLDNVSEFRGQIVEASDKWIET